MLLGVIALTWGMGTQSLPPDAEEGNTLIYRAEIPHGEWAGWNFNPPPHRPVPKPEQFELVNSDGKNPRTFSGKVVGLESMDGVAVGLESLVGIPWIHEDEYQWEKVAPDGSFSLTDARFTHADKAIAMRGPQTAWTFLRFNFAPNHGAKNIVLQATPSKEVKITASGPDMENLSDVMVEVFDAYSQVDDRGNWLNRQRLGTFESQDEKSLNALVPVGEVALFVHREGWAGFYQIIDTRKADHFHFVMMPGGELNIRALDQNGMPMSGLSVNWKNPAAPLSYWEFKTDENGEFHGHDLVPGTFEINIPGFGARTVEVPQGYVTTALFQEGKDFLISRRRMAIPPK
jgi:hypothetical protein